MCVFVLLYPLGIPPAAACIHDRLLSRCFPSVFVDVLHFCSLSEKVYPLGPIWAPGPQGLCIPTAPPHRSPSGCLPDHREYPQEPTGPSDYGAASVLNSRGSLREGELSGNTTKSMLGWTYKQALPAPPVGAARLLRAGLFVTLLSFLSGGLTLLKISEGSLRPLCATCALTFPSPKVKQRLFWRRITASWSSRQMHLGFTKYALKIHFSPHPISMLRGTFLRHTCLYSVGRLLAVCQWIIFLNCFFSLTFKVSLALVFELQYSALTVDSAHL